MILYSIMLTCFLLFFGMTIFREFDTRWDEFLLSMEQFPPDDILESLYKLRIRESEELKTVLELYNLEIHQKKAPPHHQKKAKPHHHRLKTLVQNIEQDLIAEL